MKKILYTIIGAILALTACEVIPADNQIIEVFTPVDPTSIQRTSLLIEYSGWQCVNCPTAAEVAHELKEQYGDNLVVVVMHPESNPNTRHNNKPELNYTCPEADIVYKHMGGTNTTPFPTGNVNMIMDADSYFSSMDKWATLISNAYSHAHPIILGQTVVANEDTTSINIHVEISNMHTEAKNVNLIVWLTEDGVIGKQKKPTGTDNEYAHNHLLRASISPTMGDELAIAAQQTAQKQYEYTLPEKVVGSNCSIVTLVVIDGEVVQATETKIGE